MKAFVLEKQL